MAKTNHSNSLEYKFNKLSHVFIAIVAVYMTFTTLKLGFTGTALHAFLCTIGYNVLMLEGGMTFYPHNLLTKSLSKTNKVRVHLVLQVLGGVCGMAGAGVKFLDKETHFDSLHGKLGLAANLFSAWALANGLASMYAHKIKHLTPFKIKTIHNAVGLTAILLGLQAVVTGMQRGFYQKHIDDRLTGIMTLVVIATFGMAVIVPVKALYSRVRTLFKTRKQT
ncbi:hypothetical protein ACFFRR_003982 [Megaselia abdita]